MGSTTTCLITLIFLIEEVVVYNVESLVSDLVSCKLHPNLAHVYHLLALVAVSRP